MTVTALDAFSQQLSIGGHEIFTGKLMHAMELIRNTKDAADIGTILSPGDIHTLCEGNVLIGGEGHYRPGTDFLQFRQRVMDIFYGTVNARSQDAGI